MNDADLLTAIQHLAANEQIRITTHAHQEMTAEAISLDDVIHAISTGQIIENYPTHRRGACCLVNGVDSTGRPIHVVCTSNQPTLIIITAYLPRPPKWLSPTQRRRTP